MEAAIRSKLDNKITPNVHDKVVAALAAESDETPAARALDRATSSVVAVRLATTFTSETICGTPLLASLGKAVPSSLSNISGTIGAVPEIDRMEPHPESKLMYLPIVTVTEGSATKSPPHADRYGWPLET